MKTLTIRINEEVLDQIEQRRGLKPRADFIREIIDTYFLKSESNELAGDSQATLNELANLKKELQHSETRISDLLSHIKAMEQQTGFLQLEYQKLSDRLLLPAAKPWWQFWKK